MCLLPSGFPSSGWITIVWEYVHVLVVVVLQDDKYSFPKVYVCLFDNNGCDPDYDVDDFCVQSAITTFGELSFVVYEDTHYVNATLPTDSVRP